MNVKELKQLLENKPDDFEVLLDLGDGVTTYCEGLLTAKFSQLHSLWDYSPEIELDYSSKSSNSVVLSRS